MIIFPAIDLKNGQCVRLYKGDMEQATVFNENPVSQALEFQSQGFKYLHIVDLDGAIKGHSVNESSVKAILRAVKIPVQLGGGIRDMAAIEEWLSIGVSRVILGTVAAKNPDLVKEACKKFPGKIVVGIDARHGMVATEGWVSSSEMTAMDLGKKFENCGVAAIIYTDVSRDGTMEGVDIEGTKQLAKHVSIPVIASGGISSMKDVLHVKALEKDGVFGLIVGRALYDKMIDANALAAL
ncbi:MAG: 1-(5-phosphoribosyl)-5-[(5-phosphoribosylamino)methylideneamino]imidazole-4-carboxamide isomerase [Rickettsiales bacterium]|nr:1-(5-phosphoribosyl)-5-[(5-phosphoribosylamino)methylideneamino]imidazole-4-carboxamide isomerase [Rickettsiales bacterium]